MEDDWYHCFFRDGKFEGAGGPCNLIDILYIFEKWANTRPNPHNNPHMHVEELIKGEWRGPRIYPTNVPHN